MRYLPYVVYLSIVAGAIKPSRKTGSFSPSVLPPQA
jgi:hypothetical protein